ncbi:MAG: hypothetical protein HRT57_05965 [Crocinitomicaceae bacterium]|nr:hypothetical protein [Crocinitomicaceae bacterium]
MSKEIPSNPVKTSLVICLGFTVIGLLIDQMWPFIVALSVGGIGATIPWLASKIEQVWFGIAKVMSYIVPNVLLTAIFFAFLFPMAMLVRVFKKSDALKLKNKYESMYVTPTSKFDVESFERPF